MKFLVLMLKRKNKINYQEQLDEAFRWYKKNFPLMEESDCLIMAERDIEYEYMDEKDRQRV